MKSGVGLVRDNPALAAGIGLPVLVVLFFMLATLVPAWLVAPPRYDALFAVRVPNFAVHESTDVQVKFDVEDGRLKAWRRIIRGDSADIFAVLYLFDAHSLQAREIAIPPTSGPGEADDEWHEVSIPEVQSLALDPDTQSPDGYAFHDRSEESAGFWPLFVGGSERNRIFVGKDGREIKIRLSDSNGYRNPDLEFLGWVVSPRGGR